MVYKGQYKHGLNRHRHPCLLLGIEPNIAVLELAKICHSLNHATAEICSEYDRHTNTGKVIE
jgi:hypothetical protein